VKKTVALILSLIILLSAASCGKEEYFPSYEKQKPDTKKKSGISICHKTSAKLAHQPMARKSIGYTIIEWYNKTIKIANPLNLVISG